MDKIASALAAPNIALVKYWGKRDDLLKRPLNDSISLTLDSRVLRSRTTILLSDRLSSDIFFINDKRVEDTHIAEALMLARKRLGPRYPPILQPMLVISDNNFPTSAGLASSASGFAALATAIASALGISNAREKSILARLGSGSASRSIFGGFVRWKAGSRPDGEDSYAVQIAPLSHWPGVVDVIAISDEGKKAVSSKAGMERTASTSELYECRLKQMPARLARVEQAIRSRVFAALALETMKESNSMHAAMLDSWPPIAYMNDVSHTIVDAVHRFNGPAGPVRAAYTFDAGPNAHVITMRKDVAVVKKMLKNVAGVKKVLVSGIGGGAQAVAPDKKLVAQTLKKLKIRLK